MSEWAAESDSSTEVIRTVGKGDVCGLMAAWREAQAMAEQFREVLRATGLAADVVDVVGTLTDAGVPVVHAAMSLDGTLRFARLLDLGAHPPPSRPSPRETGGGDVEAA